MKTITLDGVEYKLTPVKKEIEKWQPKGGNYYVDLYGDACHGLNARYSRTFGIEFQTKQQAKTASKLMRQRNRLICYVLEHEPDWDFEFKPEENNHYICFDCDADRFFCSSNMDIEDISKIYIPKKVAEKLVDDLNNGVFEL
jgi:hypothetical protein